MWLPNDGSDAPKIPSGKGKRLIVLHAGTRSEGLIDGCDLVLLAKSKDGDYHQEMNSSRKRKVVLCKIVLENSFFLTKIWSHRIFCFNIVITCII
jgi:hypothetical protein